MLRTSSHGGKCLPEIYDQQARYEDLWHSPLANRAWILQEPVLAPRTLHFAENELIWECDEVLADEKQHDGAENMGYLSRGDRIELKSEFGNNWTGIVS